MGIALHDGTVHKCAGVAFVTVADHILDRVLGCESQSPLPACGKSAASASPEPGILHDLADIFRSHFRKCLLCRRISLFCNVFADAGGFNRAVRENNAVLSLVERDVMVAAVMLAVDRALIEKTLNHISADDGLVDDLGSVGSLDFGVENAVRLDAEQRPHLAESLTAALGHIVRIFPDLFFFEIEIDVESMSFKFFENCVLDGERTVCNASCSCADDDSFLDGIQLSFIIFRTYADINSLVAHLRGAPS